MIGPLPLASIPLQDEALRGEVIGFLRESLGDLTADARARSWMGFDAAFSRKLAERGWIGLTFPREYGGCGRGHFARFVLAEELLAAGAPAAAHWIADRQSGPLILKYGTESQKRFYLPRICRAEAFFCIGMSEPNSGSDLASVSSHVKRTAEGWCLTGHKIWTTHAHRAHYMIALVRSSGSVADRDQGLSQFVVDLALPGVIVRPIRDLAGDAHFSEIFFDDVQLGEDALIGVEGQGWAQVTAELAFERSGPERIYTSITLLEEWIRYLKTHGRRDQFSVILLGRFIAHLAVLRQLSIALTQRLADGASPVTEAALIKDLGTEYEQTVPALMADALNVMPEAAGDPALLKTLAYVLQVAPSYSLRGGTREILRGVIARGLGLR